MWRFFSPLLCRRSLADLRERAAGAELDAQVRSLRAQPLDTGSRYTGLPEKQLVQRGDLRQRFEAGVGDAAVAVEIQVLEDRQLAEGTQAPIRDAIACEPQMRDRA